MNTVKNVTKNISYLSLTQILSYIIGFFTLVYSARYFGVENFGILSFAIAFTSIFGIISDIGLNTLATREVARNKSLSNQYLVNFTLIKVFLALITITTTIIAVNFMETDEFTATIIYILTLSVVLNSFSQTFYAIFQAFEKMELQTIGTIFNSILIFLGLFIVISYQSTIAEFAAVYTFSSFVVFLINIFIYYWKFNWKSSKEDGKLDLDFWKPSIKEALPFAVTGISITVYLWIDSVLLSVLNGAEAVGIYNAAYKLILTTVVIPVIFNTSIFPVMSRYFASSKKNLNTAFEKLLKAMIFLAIPMGIGTMFVADKIIIFVYGEQYLNSIIALQILIWSAVLIFARSPFERLLESSNKQLTVTKIFAIGVLFNVVLNWILIPVFSYIGAGFVTIGTDLLVLILLITSTKRLGFMISPKTVLTFIKIVVASLVMGLVLFFIMQLNLILIIIAAAIIYFMTTLILGVFDEDEILMFKSLIK